MGESAADVMQKLRLMKEAKTNKAALTSKQGLKRKARDSAQDVMEKLRKMKEMKKANSAVGSMDSRTGLRIIDPEDDDDVDDLGAEEDEEDVASEEDGLEVENQDDEQEDEFIGFDDDYTKSKEMEKAMDDDDDEPIVIRFDGSRSERMIKAPTPKDRRFMSASAPKPEILLEKRTARYQSKQKPKLDDDESMNLKHDVDLQRLITESHILSDASRKGGALSLSQGSFDTIGKARTKAMEARIASLALQSGGKMKASKKDYYSINPQALLESQNKKFNKEKMPMQMRKGMVQEKAARQEKYEKNAKEAGIVLPKPPRKQKDAKQMRDRGLKIQAVGRFTPSGLRLSQSEIARHRRH
ncbi:hypothetical protein V1525DRAFT_413938 [Lipomyces kononenkoae]|uniref:Uncharacterized protein n=1 Tax=Lipomyces kononenkoae TaxID=34357 RepID=A0ACC3SRD0_LIPKO